MDDKRAPPDEKQTALALDAHDSESDINASAKTHGVEAVFEEKARLINAAIHEIGWGRYQWWLFVVAGFGWGVDNLFLQGVATVLGGVQSEFNPSHIAQSTVFLYVGLILGAFFFGISADIVGRKPAWNATLFISGVFGVASGASTSFSMWCTFICLVGFGCGGNLPIDGALYIEFVDRKRQWTLTLLSAWWAAGQVLGALITWPFLVQHSCPTQIVPAGSGRTFCLPGTFDQNKGWRYSMYTMGSIVLFLFVIRFAVFRMPESPKWLASQGRDEEVIAALDQVAKTNGKVNPLRLEQLQEIALRYGVPSHEKLPTKTVLRRNLSAFTFSHIKPLFSTRKLAINTSLVIAIYAILGLAYPLFNGFLPLILLQIPGQTADQAYSGYALQAFCGLPGSFFAAALVEWKVTGRWAFIGGRRGAMAISTALSGVFLFAFAGATNRAQVTAFNCLASFFENAFYGVLYSYAPEVFPTPSRGTGDALAATASRLAGIIAPIIKGWATSTNTAPVYISAGLFMFAAGLMLCLPVETAGEEAM